MTLKIIFYRINIIFTDIKSTVPEHPIMALLWSKERILFKKF